MQRHNPLSNLIRDENGRIIYIQDQNGETSYQYDNRGLLTYMQVNNVIKHYTYNDQNLVESIRTEQVNNEEIARDEEQTIHYFDRNGNNIRRERGTRDIYETLLNHQGRILDLEALTPRTINQIDDTDVVMQDAQETPTIVHYTFDEFNNVITEGNSADIVNRSRRSL